MARHKYGAKKTVVDGITFDSKMESRRYRELLLLKRAGLITSLELQPKFELQPGFKDGDGKRQRAIHYIADFSYREKGNARTVVEDVKGVETAVFKLKLKLFLFRYPEYELRVVKC